MTIVPNQPNQQNPKITPQEILQNILDREDRKRSFTVLLRILVASSKTGS